MKLSNRRGSIQRRLAILFILLSAACASHRAGATPLAELSLGLNPLQLPQAEFPGGTASLAVNPTKMPRVGMGLVLDADSSYLRTARMAGARLYGRTQPLYRTPRTVTAFVQVLAGSVTGGDSGVVHSHGGLAVQPGVGLDYGSGPCAVRIGIDYRHVAGGFVDDDRIAGRHVATLSGPRLMIGLTFRMLPR
jgi:hypothetical protein